MFNATIISVLYSKEDCIKELLEQEGKANVGAMYQEIEYGQGGDNAVCRDCLTTGRVEPDNDSGYCFECKGNHVAHLYTLTGAM